MHNGTREQFWRLLDRSGVTAALRTVTRGFRILTYHSFSPAPWNGVADSQTMACLRAQLRFLTEHFEVVSLAKGLLAMSQRSFGPRQRVAITIDDGYADNYHLLYPILKELNLRATVFLTTDYLDTGRLIWPVRIFEILLATRKPSMTWPIQASLTDPVSRAAVNQRLRAHLAPLDPERRLEILAGLAVQLGLSHETQLPPLTWDQVREMASDLVEFGSHTVYHSFLPLLSSSAARTELEASKRRIEEETGRPCRMFAYPNGDYDAVSAAHVAAAGYKAALTQRLGVNRPSTSPYELARIHVPPDYAPHAFAFRVSTPPVTDLLVRAWTLMRSARNCFRAAPAA